MNRIVLLLTGAVITVASSAEMQSQRGAVNAETLCHHQRVIKPLEHHQRVLKPLQKKTKPQKRELIERDKTDTEVS